MYEAEVDNCKLNTVVPSEVITGFIYDAMLVINLSSLKAIIMKLSVIIVIERIYTNYETTDHFQEYN